VEFDGLASFAMIDRVLKAFGIGALFIRVAQPAVRRTKARFELYADGRNVRFDNGPPVLRE
jgi:hypothetical protein